MGVVYSLELLSQARAWLVLHLNDKRTPAGLEALTSLYTAITGESSSTCRQCQYSDYAALVSAYIREATSILNPEIMSDKQYTIAPGFEAETFVHENYSKAVTADNFTNEDAEFFIANGGTHIFIAMPGTEIGADGKKKPEPRLKSEFQARFAELFGDEADDKLTVAQLTEHIEAKEADPAYQVPVA